MNRLREIYDIYRSTIERDYADDISLAIVYGSAVNGTADEYSDLDVLIIPKTERGARLGQTYLLDGIGYDLWCGRWEILEAMARLEDLRLSILLDAEVMASDAEGLARFRRLQAEARERLAGEARREKAEACLSRAERAYGRFLLYGDWTDAGWMLTEMANARCLLDGTYLKFGIKKLSGEWARMLSDGDFGENARMTLRKLRSELPEMEPDACPGLYEEIASCWNKIRRACRSGNAVEALLAAASLQSEIGSRFRLIDVYDPCDLRPLLEAADAAERAYTAFLRERGIPIKRYESTAELAAALGKEDI